MAGLINTRTNKMICSNYKIASKFFDRLVGLMFSDDLVGFDCLWIKRCNSIHTFFMRYPIDVVFINSHLKVKKIIRNMRPWRVSWFYLTASETLEFKAGTLDQDIKKGDVLEAKCIN